MGFCLSASGFGAAAQATPGRRGAGLDLPVLALFRPSALRPLPSSTSLELGFCCFFRLRSTSGRQSSSPLSVPCGACLVPVLATDLSGPESVSLINSVWPSWTRRLAASASMSVLF